MSSKVSVGSLSACPLFNYLPIIITPRRAVGTRPSFSGNNQGEPCMYITNHCFLSLADYQTCKLSTPNHNTLICSRRNPHTSTSHNQPISAIISSICVHRAPQNETSTRPLAKQEHQQAESPTRAASVLVC